MGFAFGSTVTGGIQDVSALLPLVGTEQCEDHVGSALLKGYLYPVFAPITIFGSLGLAKAGMKACIASAVVRSRAFFGAKKLADAGFTPTGAAMALIHWDGERHGAESRFIDLLDEHHLRDMSKLKVDSKTLNWNLWMFLLSLLAIILSFTPYIYFIERTQSEPLFLRWIFPVARSVGSLLIATMIQLLLQTRILQIVKYRMVFMSLDEKVKAAKTWITPELKSWDSRKSSEKAVYDLEHHLRISIEPTSDDREDKYGSSPQLRIRSLRALWRNALGVLGNRFHTNRVGGGDLEKADQEEEVDKSQLQHQDEEVTKGDKDPNNQGGAIENVGEVREEAGVQEIEVLEQPEVSRVLPDADHVEDNDNGDEEEEGGNDEKHQCSTKDTRAALKKALDDAMETHLPSATKSRFWWTLLIARVAILMGIFLSLVGYIGCFSLVQNSGSSVGSLIWLGCEVALSLLRLMIWSWNPKWDEGTEISLTLKLSPGRALSSCTQSTEELDESKRLPLMRAREFLNGVTSCVGLVAPFDGGTGAVHYTLSASLSKRMKTLYATIYDYKENLTRIVIRRPSEHAEAKTDFHFATLNNDHDEATIGEPISDKDKDEFVAEHPSFFADFEKHCNSILRDGSSDREVSVKLSWEVRTTEEAKEYAAEDQISEHDGQYVSIGLMEKAKTELDEKRADWVALYMGVVTREERLGLQEEKESKDLVDTLETAAAEILLLHEWWEMEKTLMEGSRRAEDILHRRYGSVQADLEGKRDNDGSAARLEGIRKKNAASRLADEAKQMEERLKKRGDEIRKRIGEERFKSLTEIDLESELSKVEESIKEAWNDLLKGRGPWWRDTCIATEDDPLRLLLYRMDGEIENAKIDGGSKFEDAKKRARERKGHMWHRLDAEKRKLDALIGRLKRPDNSDLDLGADRAFVDACEASAGEGSGGLAWLSSRKAVFVDSDVIERDGIAAVREALERNPSVTVVDCRECSAENVIDVIKALKKAKQVSLMVSDNVVEEFRGSEAQGLLDALQINKNIISLGRPLDALPALRHVIESNRNLVHDRHPLVFYENVSGFGSVWFSQQTSRCTVRFPYRETGEWMLRLLHRFHSEALIEIKLNGEDVDWTKDEQPVDGFGRQDIPLPVVPPTPDGFNEITIEMAPGFQKYLSNYYLMDVKLVWEDSDAGELSGASGLTPLSQISDEVTDAN